MPEKRGRPPKKATDRKETVLRIRLTAAERTTLDRAANGKTSTWARETLLNAVKQKA